MKKLIISVFLIIFLTFIIYKTNDNNLIDYMSIGDSFDVGINSYGNNTYSFHDYIKNYLDNNNNLHKTYFYYSKPNYKIKELLEDIKNNKEIIFNDKSHNIKKDLREADLITIAIGMDELVNILEYDKELNNTKTIYEKIDEMIINMDNLLKTVKKISSSNIVLIGYYNPSKKESKEINRLFSYIDDKYLTICKKYKITYVDIYKTIKNNRDYLPNYKDYHINSKGYLKVASKIIDKLKY